MRKFILSFFVLATVSQVMAQTNYFVSSLGNDGNTGTLSQPWEHVQHSLDQLSAGDTLNLLAGEYHEKVTLNVSGTSGQKITVRNNNTDEAILDGTGAGSAVAMLLISSENHITIEGLTIRNNQMLDAQGILIEGGSDGITIQNCAFHDINFSSNPNATVDENKNAQPLIVYGTLGNNSISNLKLINNEIKDCRTGYSEALAVNGNVDGFEVRSNSVHDITNIGIDIIGHEGTSPNAANDQARNGTVTDNTITNCISEYATSGGIYVDGGKNIVIERNLSHHNGYGIEIGCENIGTTTDNITVRNNILADNEICGLAMGGFDFPSGSGKVINCLVRNNTLINNDFSGSFTGELFLTYSENCTISSNIFETSSQNTLAYTELTQPGLNMDYNLIHCFGNASNLEVDWNGSSYQGYASFTTGTGYEANGQFGNPLFIGNGNTIALDLLLSPNSPAVDLGDSNLNIASDETDYFGSIRIAGNSVDCGAIEFGSISVVVAPSENIVGFFDVHTGLLHLQSSMINKPFQLYSVFGQLVEEGVFSNLVVNFSGLVSGEYILRFQNQKHIKFIVVQS